MKKTFITLATFSLLILSAASCEQNNSETVWTGIVTVKTAGDGSCQLQVDDKKILIPTNESLKTNPYKKEVRAMTNYYDKGTISYSEKEDLEYRSAQVISMDSVLTKKPVPSTEDNDKAYGTNTIALYNSWITVVEDGYLTLHFTAPWGNSGIPHTMNLVTNSTSDPLCFEFRHNANGDAILPNFMIDGIVAFDISEALDTLKAPYHITVKYYGVTTPKRTVTFDYTPGTSAHMTVVNGESQSGEALK